MANGREARASGANLSQGARDGDGGASQGVPEVWSGACDASEDGIVAKHESRARAARTLPSGINRDHEVSDDAPDVVESNEEDAVVQPRAGPLSRREIRKSVSGSVYVAAENETPTRCAIDRWLVCLQLSTLVCADQHACNRTEVGDVRTFSLL